MRVPLLLAVALSTTLHPLAAQESVGTLSSWDGVTSAPLLTRDFAPATIGQTFVASSSASLVTGFSFFAGYAPFFFPDDLDLQFHAYLMGWDGVSATDLLWKSPVQNGETDFALVRRDFDFAPIALTVGASYVAFMSTVEADPFTSVPAYQEIGLVLGNAYAPGSLVQSFASDFSGLTTDPWLSDADADLAFEVRLRAPEINPPTPVPEPAGIVLLCVALLALFAVRAKRHRTVLLLGMLSVVSCKEAPTAFETHSPELVPELEIAHAGNAGSSAGFYFLPPLVQLAPANRGAMDNDLLEDLEIRVCELGTNSECVTTGFSRSFTSTTGGFFDKLKLVRDKQYLLYWSSRPDNLDANKFYRLSVIAHGTSLGFVDLDVVTNTAELAAVDRTQFAPLVRGGTLPVAFAIEVGATDPPVEALRGASIVAGNGFTCGLTSAGQAYCWGEGGDGRLGLGTILTGDILERNRVTPAPVSGGLTFRALVARGDHACGLTTTNEAYCWGSNGSGQLGNGTFERRAGPDAVTGGLSFASLTSGRFHTCGLTDAGIAYCWGLNSSGQLGDGTLALRNTPSAVVGGLVFAELTAGSEHTCGRTVSGDAYCWGNNNLGPLGNGSPTATPQPTPSRVSGDLAFVALHAGEFHTCGLIAGGDAYCWGDNGLGQLGDASFSSTRSTPVAVGGGLIFRSISVGWRNTCGLTGNGTAHCWGGNQFGQIGNGTANPSNRLPVPVSGGLSFSELAIGQFHACGVIASGDAFCWGRNDRGEVGNGYLENVPEPAPVSGGVPFADVSSGASFACGLTSGGATQCWGSNTSGQLGGGDLSPRFAAVTVLGGLSFTQVTTGSSHACGLTAFGVAYCWGNNDSGQLGSVGGNRSEPTAVSGGLAFALIAAGGSSTCGIAVSGTTYCWGSNSQGQLGIGTIGFTSNQPIAIDGSLLFQSISLGSGHACGITGSGAVYCWGWNTSGQLGEGSFNRQLSPTIVLSGQSFVEVTLGQFHTCGRTVSGAAYCWGSNAATGDGSSINRTTPFPVFGNRTFSALSAGDAHTCGITVAGQLFCWGINGSGQLGLPAPITPTAVQGGILFRVQ